MPKPETTAIRCAICGKPIKAGDAVADIHTGKLRKDQVSMPKDWGVTHKSCFDRAMPSPKAALAEIRRLAKTG